MALATRNLYLVLKARDEASRVVRGFGRELTRAGQLAQAESARAAARLATERAMYLESVGASQAEIDAQRQLARHLRNTASNLETARRQAIRFSNALHTVSASVVTVGSGLAIAGAAGLAFMLSSINVARDYEQQVRRTATQVDNFTATLDQLSQVGLDVANRIAVPFEQIQPALYNILSSTNANLEQAAILLEAFAKTAVAGMVSLEDASRGTIPILNAFNIPLEDVNRILDIQFQLVRKGVGTYGEFAAVFGRVVPSATRAGQTFEEVAAMLAYLTRNGLTAAMAASSSARALDALSHPTAVQNLENMGVAVRNLEGQFLPLEQILMSLRTKLDALPESERVAQLVEIFKGAGGTIQARRFLEQVLLRPGELEEFIGYLGDMKDSSGQFEAAYDEMSESVASQTELLRNKWKILQEGVGRILTPAFIEVIKWLQRVLDKFNELDPRTKKIIVILTALGFAFALVAGLVLIVIGVLAGIAAAIVTAGAGFFYLIGAIALLVTGLGILATTFGILWEKSDNFRLLLKQMKDGVVELWQEAILPAAKEIKAAFDEKMRPALERLWEVFETKILPVLQDLYKTFKEKIIPAAKEIANFIKDILVKAFNVLQVIIDDYVIPAFNKLTTFYYEHKETIDELITVLVFLGKWLLKIAIVVGVILLAVFAGPIIAAIALLVAGFIAAGIALVYLIEWVKGIIGWLGKFDTETAAKITAIKQYFADGIDFIKAYVREGLEYVLHLFLDHLISVKNLVVNTWNSIPGVIAYALGVALNYINMALYAIEYYFNAAKDMMYNAGRNLIQGLIDGIVSKVDGVTSAIANVARIIYDHLPHSPARKGPLSGSGSLYRAGQTMVRQLSDGMNSSSLLVPQPTGAMAMNARASILAPPSGAGMGRTITQNIVVNTQEINPVRQSAELGWLLAGRS